MLGAKKQNKFFQIPNAKILQSTSWQWHGCTTLDKFNFNWTMTF